ncbi:MAG: hypothetical protein JNM27_17400 [Leptospirales bacterium]|nr:hypothetical protein [Leptospirales bacterium]
MEHGHLGNLRMQTSAPGRICLFGEHQDYLGLPVIAMAVNLRFHIEFTQTSRRDILIRKPDLGPDAMSVVDLFAEKPAGPDDFCWGIARTLIEDGFDFPFGGEATFKSRIPLRAGCSSSSAMSAAWMRLLLEIGTHPDKEKLIRAPEEVAYLVYKGEKEKFHGAGGMMDQYACYLGGLIHVFPENAASGTTIGSLYGVEKLPLNLEGIVLIDSGEPKDTQGVLSSVSQRARNAVAQAAMDMPGFDLVTSTVDEVESNISPTMKQKEHWKITVDHLKNRDLCREGLKIFRTGQGIEQLGAMLDEEHRILAETLGISTPRINWILDLARKSGATGGKINGSGGGGTCFCYAPDPDARRGLLEAFSRNGIRHFEVTSDVGARRED